LTRLGRGGVPRRAILAGTVVGFISVIFEVFSPDRVFAFIVNSYGAVALFVYLMIAISQVVLRRRADRDGRELTLRMWLFPWLSYLTIGAMAAVAGAMAVLPDTRTQFFVSLLTVLVVLGAYQARVAHERRRADLRG
jgi:L-asparagine transporter-like permease